MWKTLVISVLCLGLVACQPRESVPSSWLEPGVSKTLASFRKEQLGAVSYDLFFSIPRERSEAVRGTVGMTVSLQEPQPWVVDFRATPEQVLSVRLNGEVVPYRMESEHLIVERDFTVAGQNRLDIAFVSADQSLNRRDEFLYTLLVPDRARTLFPCMDQPNLKALYRLTLEVPADWQAVSNGAVQTVDSLSVLGRKRIAFRQTEPLSTYLFSFVAGKLTREPFVRDGREIAIYHRETDPQKVAQCPDIANEVFDALVWLEDYTAIPYPFAKYDLIILPGFQYGGMEHTGATLYNDSRMFLDAHPTLNARLSRSALIAHETAHMWFGDFVTMDWFDDVWTKEVFANYFASLMVEPLFPEVNHRLNFIRGYLPASYGEDRTAGSTPIQQELSNLRDAGLVYGNIIYNKSPVMMEMLVKMLGPDAFQQGIRQYLKTYAYGNATWDKLIAILDSYTDQNLAAWSEAWVHEKGMPTLTARIEEGTLVVRQQDSWGRGLRWPQEVQYRVISSTGEEETVKVPLTGISDEVRVPLQRIPDKGAVVIPNTDGRGYGCFHIASDAATRNAVARLFATSPDEVLRGSLLIHLYENLRQGGWTATDFRCLLLDYLPKESNPLLYSMALGYVGSCQALLPVRTIFDVESCRMTADPDISSLQVEEALWQLAMTFSRPTARLQAFRQYRSVATSSQAIDRLYTIWKTRRSPLAHLLSDEDYTSLAYKLALYRPADYVSIIGEQRTRIANPDRRQAFDFVAPSLSPDVRVRDSVFAALLIAENRRIEPWASSALANLNHRVRGEQAVAYIRPGLEILQEVQRTGDIFFPKSWVGALLGGHQSVAARRAVDDFFQSHPDYPDKLASKIRQQAHHLFVPMQE